MKKWKSTLDQLPLNSPKNQHSLLEIVRIKDCPCYRNRNTVNLLLIFITNEFSKTGPSVALIWFRPLIVFEWPSLGLTKSGPMDLSWWIYADPLLKLGNIINVELFSYNLIFTHLVFIRYNFDFNDFNDRVVGAEICLEKHA